MLFDISRGAEVERGERFRGRSCLCVRNVVPRRLLAPRFQAAHAAVLFSATLAPHDFYLDVLGLPKDTDTLDVGAPFQAQQLTITLVSSISTRYRHRGRSLEPIAELIATQLRARPGNYLAPFSSFGYMHAAAAHLASRHPAIERWQQAQQMNEPERERFLTRFVAGGSGVGFAVLGGAFAEGIDLPGERLVGAFIATLGLPPVNCINAELERRMNALFGSGHDYTYLFPGLQKVVQAAGRVIRAPSEHGVLYLIDDRINHSKVRNLLPAWWRISAVD